MLNCLVVLVLRVIASSDDGLQHSVYVVSAAQEGGRGINDLLNRKEGGGGFSPREHEQALLLDTAHSPCLFWKIFTQRTHTYRLLSIHRSAPVVPSKRFRVSTDGRGILGPVLYQTRVSLAWFRNRSGNPLGRKA